MNRRRFLVLSLGATALLAACQSPQAAATPQPKPAASASQAPTASEAVKKLKVGTLPVVDVLPMFVAQQERIYEKRQIEIELLPFQSALERDAAIQANAIDGQLNDLISSSLLNKDKELTQIIRLTHQGSPSMAMMVILASGKSDIKTPADLKNVEIGISKNSVIEYATDRMLQQAGLKETEIAKIEVTQIPVRAEMLSKDQLKAATLPEPLASLAVLQGARVVLDDSQTGIGTSVLSFRKDVLSANPEGVRRFMLAYEDAVAGINGTPEKYRDLMIETAKVPEALRATVKLPKYPTASVPKEIDVKSAMDWCVAQQLVPTVVPYDRMVNPSFLPKA